MDPYQRRAVDADGWNVESMIAEEDDPKQRLSLIIMNSIKNAVLANTKVAEATAKRLDEHLTNYDKHTQAEAALINKGIGAWKVIAWVLGVAQAGLIAGVGYLMADLKEMHADIKASAIVDAQVDLRLSAVETIVHKPQEKTP